jgi:hypothetical protein
MTGVHTPDRQSQLLLLVLAVLGTVLAVVGWFRAMTLLF